MGWVGAILKEHELREWGVSRRAAIALLIVPPVGAVVVALTGFWYPLFRMLTAEDHIFEWVQFFCWVVVFLSGIAMTQRLWTTRRRGVAVLWAIVALGAFVIAGEEIAWGQRLFGLETPDALARVNRQGEITVHNIGSWGLVFDAVFIVAGLYGAGSAFWYRLHRPPPNRQLVDLLVPPLFLVSLFLAVPLYKTIRAGLWLVGVPSFVDYAEYIELCLVFGLASFGVLSLRRQKPEFAGTHRMVGPASHRAESRSQAGRSS